MGWSKNWKYGFPWESAHANKLLKGIRNAGNAAADERIAGGEFAAGVSREQRDWSDKNIRPIERGLSEVLRKRLADGGQDGVTADAMAGTGAAFDRSQEGAARSASRFGVTIDPEFSRGVGLDRTKAMIEAGTMAARDDRDAAGRDAQRFYQAGRSLPGLATQEFIAGAGSIADQGDFDTGRQVGEALGKTDTQSGLSDNFADGGQVGGVGRVIDGESSRVGDGDAGTVDLETEDFIVPEFAVKFYGREFWDKKVVENGGDIADVEAGETDSVQTESYEQGYADGGNVEDENNSGLQVSGGYKIFNDGDARGTVGGGRVGYKTKLGDGDLTAGISFNAHDVKFQKPDGMGTSKDIAAQDFDLSYEKGGNRFGINAGQRRAGLSYSKKFAHGGEVYADGGSVFDTSRLKNKHTEEYSSGQTDKQFPEWLEENGYTTAGDGHAERQDVMVAKRGRQPDNRVRTPDFLFEPREYQNKTAYANGGVVGSGLGDGIRAGYAGGIGNIITSVKNGLTAGLLDARQTEEHDARMSDNKEDRAYLREDRAYQGKQRQAAEKKSLIAQETDKAGALWASGDGGDLQPLFDVGNKYFGAAPVAVDRGADGKTVRITKNGSDGTPSVQEISIEEARAIGHQTYQMMRDPQGAMKELNGKPDTVTTAEGGITKEKNRRTGKWETVSDNPKDSGKDEAGKKYNALSNANAISKLIGERLGGKYDDITGKMIKPPDDPEMATALTAAAHEYERTNPGAKLPGEVVKMVFDNVAGVPREDDVRKKVRKEIADKTRLFSTDETDLGMPRKDYENKRVKEEIAGGIGAPKPPAAAKPIAVPPGFKPTMVQAVNAIAKGKDQNAVAARMKEMGHSDAEVRATLDFYKQNARR